MTNEEAKKKLEARLKCIMRKTSGRYLDCNFHNCDNCSLLYAQGNMEEQKATLNMAIIALKQQIYKAESEDAE